MAQQAVLTDRWRAVPKSWQTVALEASPAKIPIYDALGEYANNTTAQLYPIPKAFLRTLGIACRSVQRLLGKRFARLGLIESLKRRRDERGRFLGYRLRVVAHLAGAGEEGRER